MQDGPWRLWPLSPSLGFWPHGATGGGPAVPGASRSAASPLNAPRRSHEPSAEHLSQEWLCGLGVAGRRPSQAALRRTEGRCAWLRPPLRLGRWSAGRSPPCGAGGTRPPGPGLDLSSHRLHSSDHRRVLSPPGPRDPPFSQCFPRAMVSVRGRPCHWLLLTQSLITSAQRRPGRVQRDDSARISSGRTPVLAVSERGRPETLRLFWGWQGPAREPPAPWTRLSGPRRLQRRWPPYQPRSRVQKPPPWLARPVAGAGPTAAPLRPLYPFLQLLRPHIYPTRSQAERCWSPTICLSLLKR